MKTSYKFEKSKNSLGVPHIFPAVISPKPLIDVIKIPKIGINQIINEIGKNIL